MQASRLFTATLSLGFVFVWYSLYPQAQILLKVAPQPLSIAHIGNSAHIFCGQIDQDFDGVQDSTDLPPSWWIFDASSFLLQHTVQLPWNSLGFPVRVAIDSVNNRIYIPGIGKIYVYDLSSQQQIDSIETQAPVRSTAIDIPSQTLYYCIDRFDDTSFVIAYNLQSNESAVVFAIDTVDFLQSVLPVHRTDGTFVLAVLFEGNFGTEDSYLYLLYPDTTIGIPIGNLGNHLAVSGDTVLVTMNGSHQIHLFDLNKKRIVKSIPTQTSGFDGPRESQIWNTHYLLTTTYYGDLRIFSLTTGEMLNSLNIYGKAEGFQIIHRRPWIARAFQPASYDYDSAVVVLPPIIINAAEDQHSSPSKPKGIKLFIDNTTKALSISLTEKISIDGLIIVSYDGKTLYEQKDIFLSPGFHTISLPPSIFSQRLLFVMLRVPHHILTYPLFLQQ